MIPIPAWVPMVAMLWASPTPPKSPTVLLSRTAVAAMMSQPLSVTIRTPKAPTGQQNRKVVVELWNDGYLVAGDSLPVGPDTSTVVWRSTIPMARPDYLSTSRVRVRTLTTTSQSPWAVVEGRRRGVSTQGEQGIGGLLPDWSQVAGTVSGTTSGIGSTVTGVHVMQRGASLTASYAEARIGARGTPGHLAGVMVRMPTGVVSGYVLTISPALGTDTAIVQLSEATAGTLVPRFTITTRWVVNGVLRLEAVGDNVVGYYNSVQVGAFRSALHPTGKMGVYIRGNSLWIRQFSAGAVEPSIPAQFTATVPVAALGGSDSVRFYVRTYADSARVPVGPDLLVGTSRGGPLTVTVPMRKGWRYGFYGEPYIFGAPLRKYHLGKIQLES